MAEHSCRPNARVEWDVNERAMRLVATVEIEAGQRVSRSYLDIGPLLSSVSLRQEALLQDWHFHCECTRCREETSRVKLSDVETDGANAGLAFLSELDLQHCIDGLNLNDALKTAVQAATSACAEFGLPAVGTLYFLQRVLGSQAPPILKLHFPSSESSPKRCKVE
eukprot:Skav209433  [mRNA]  locus=scaffold805:177662:178159:- [translate_table: standard]